MDGMVFLMCPKFTSFCFNVHPKYKLAWKLVSFLCAFSSNNNISAMGWECENLIVAFNLNPFLER